MIYYPGDLVRCARAIAIRAHTDCNQTYGDGLPYVAHLADVVTNAVGFIELIAPLDQDVVVAAAWLHDVLEDTHTTYNDLTKQLGLYSRADVVKDVAEIVFALTNNKGRTRDERANDAYYAAIVGDPLAVYVKLCDRLANVMNAGSMNTRYTKEQGHFKAKLKRGDLYAPMWARLDAMLGTGTP